MRGLDTNILVRWLLPADAGSAQKAAVRRAVESSTDDLHVNLVALVETAWVLGSSYGLARGGLAAGLRAVLDHPRLKVERRATVEAALSAYEAGGAGFSDHLIGLLDAEAGCATTLTFDKRAARGPHFTLIE